MPRASPCDRAKSRTIDKSSAMPTLRGRGSRPWVPGLRSVAWSCLPMMPSAKFPGLAGGSVLITGGGSGIGAALTEGFARQGAKVAFIDIAEAPSTAVVDRIGKEVGARPLWLRADLRDVAALRA